MHKITLIPGDGTGPELTGAAVRVLKAAGVEIDWEVQEAGERALQSKGEVLPQDVLASIRRCRVALKGPLTTPLGVGFRSVNVALRKQLDLYANVRPAKSYKGAGGRYDHIDLVIIRENTEDLYAGIEHMVGEEAAESIKIITRKASERIMRFAFNYARQNKRRKVTAVHKANIMKLSDGLFLRAAREVASQYPDIAFEEKIVDNMAMQLVLKPEKYDLLVMPNLYGDILSDLCAGLVGGLGMVPGANVGEEIALFEPVHGSAPQYAGLNKVNPTAIILSSILMLKHIKEEEAALRIEKALSEVIAEGKKVTYDLGGSATTSEMTEAICKKLQG